MEDRDRRAIEAYLEEHPYLQDAYDAWRRQEDWVELLFPGLSDVEDKPRYVLMNCLYVASGDRREKLLFNMRKVGDPNVVEESEIDFLDSVSFYERFSLDQLQMIGI